MGAGFTDAEWKGRAVSESHLIAHWTIVIDITDSHFHCGLCDKEPISGCDVEEVNVLFFSI